MIEEVSKDKCFLAIMSLVLGVISFVLLLIFLILSTFSFIFLLISAIIVLVPFLILLSVLFALLAIIFGFVALRKIKLHRCSGRGIVITGIILGFLTVLVYIFILIGIISYSEKVLNIKDPDKVISEYCVLSSEFLCVDYNVGQENMSFKIVNEREDGLKLSNITILIDGESAVKGCIVEPELANVNDEILVICQSDESLSNIYRRRVVLNVSFDYRTIQREDATHTIQGTIFARVNYI